MTVSFSKLNKEKTYIGLQYGTSLISKQIMGLTKRFTKLSIVGVSVIGSLFHSLGQIIIVAFFTWGGIIDALLPNG